MIRIYSLFILLVFPALTLSSQELDNENLRVVHGPYIQNLTANGVTIIWHTNRPAVPSVFIKSVNGNEKKIQNSHDGLIDGGGTIHKVRIEGLSPATSYTYEITSVQILKYQAYRVYYGDTLRARQSSFETPDPASEEISFAVFNDIHERSSLLSSFLRNGDTDRQELFFFNGDFLDYLQHSDQIFNGFLDSAVFYFAKSKPFYYVRGNHETRGMLARDFKNYFDFPGNSFYYGFTQGPVHFMVLDCGEDKPDSNRYYYSLADYDNYRNEEMEWIKDHIGSEEFLSAQYRVVIIHMPVIKSEQQGYGMQYLSDHFGPLLEEAGIDLMICGHTHRTIFYSNEESGFGYPVLVSSNRTFVEVTANINGIRAELKNADGNIELIKELR